MTDNTNEQTTQQPTQPTTGTPPGNQAGQGEKTFTQADVDRLIKDRLERAEASILKKYGDPKAAREAQQRLKELEDAGKSETTKLMEQLTDHQTKLSIAESGWQRAALDNAVILEALKQGVAPDRLNAALKLFDDKTITRNDDGTLTGLDAAVTKLLEENAFLKGDAPGKPTAPKLGATNPQGSGQSTDIRSWHPLTRNQGNGGFTGRLVLPSQGDKK